MYRGCGQLRDFQVIFLIILNHADKICFDNSNLGAYTDLLCYIYICTL